MVHWSAIATWGRCYPQNDWRHVRGCKPACIMPDACQKLVWTQTINGARLSVKPRAMGAHFSGGSHGEGQIVGSASRPCVDGGRLSYASASDDAGANIAAAVHR